MRQLIWYSLVPYLAVLLLSRIGTTESLFHERSPTSGSRRTRKLRTAFWTAQFCIGRPQEFRALVRQMVKLQCTGRTAFYLVRPILRLGSTALRWMPRKLCTFILVATRHVPTRFGIGARYMLLRRLAKRCGDVVALHEGVYLHNLSLAEFGDHISIHPLCYIDAYGGLRIGSNVSIAHNVSILTADHDYGRPSESIREAPVIGDSVLIGSDVWVGAGVRILAGTHIGDRVVIGAGSVVTRDIPSGSLAAGIPARVIKRIEVPRCD